MLTFGQQSRKRLLFFWVYFGYERKTGDRKIVIGETVNDSFDKEKKENLPIKFLSCYNTKVFEL